MYKVVTAPTSGEIDTFLPIADILFALGKDTDSSSADSSDNTRLATLKTVAYYNMETLLNRALLVQTIDYFTNAWEAVWRLDYTPLASVTSIKYYDGDNAQQTQTVTTDYLAFADVDEIKQINTFALYDRGDAINIRYVGGEVYTAIQPKIKEAILLDIYGLFNKEDMSMEVTTMVGDLRELVL